VSLQLEASAVGPRRAGEHAYGICITRQVRFQNKFVVARIKAEYTGRGECAGGCIKSGRRMHAPHCSPKFRTPDHHLDLGARAVLLLMCEKLGYTKKDRRGAKNGLREPHEPARKATPRVYLHYPLV